MAEHSSPVAHARAYTEAWTSHDMEATARYVAEDAVFDGPAGNAIGKEAYMAFLTPFAQTVTSLTTIAAFGDDTQALIMYDVTVTPPRVLRCAELLTFRDGKIQENKLTFANYSAR